MQGGGKPPLRAAVSADARVYGQQRSAPALEEPVLRKALSSKASHSSRTSSFVKQLSAALGWRLSDGDFQETVVGTMLLSNDVLEDIMMDKDKSKLDEVTLELAQFSQECMADDEQNCR
jgi:hypothetical protein